MKKIIIALLFFIPLIGNSQNLVPNPSFETLSTCPTDQAQLYLASPWFSPTGTFGIPMSDVYNTCAPFSSTVGVPFNRAGYQEPRTGNGYAGEAVFDNYGDKSREYISVQLISPLVAGKTYCIGFYVSLCDYNTVTQPNLCSTYAIDCLGAYLSDSAIHLNTYECIPVVPQILNPPGRFLSDTLNWMLVSGTYQSQYGGEQYITIGNFYTNDSTNNITAYPSCHSLLSYYYIDDVYVMDCADTSHGGINEIKNNKIKISVYPNPANDNITIDVSATPNMQATIEITNIEGQVIEQQTTNLETTNFVVSGLAKGMYFVKVKTEKGVAIKKFIKE